MKEFPKIISVDDHVVEPADLWQDRLPKKYLEVGPRVVRAPIKSVIPKEEAAVKGDAWHRRATPGQPGDPGEPVDWWFYEDVQKAFSKTTAAVGHDRDELTQTGATFDWYRPGCSQVKERLEDMDLNWTEASLNFPSFPDSVVRHSSRRRIASSPSCV